MAPDLREAWADLLGRRSAFASTLAPYEEVVRLWAEASPDLDPLGWTAEQCLARWRAGRPLLADAPPPLEAEAVEPVLGPVLDVIVAVRGDAAPAVQRLAEAWDAGRVTPEALLPAPGRLARLDPALDLPAEVAGFVAAATLRPFLEAWFERVREQPTEGVWTLGVCPYCGAPAGFSDIQEDGRRRLACHVCGAGWVASRMVCPYCGNDRSQDLVRLEPEAGDEGYLLSACRRCRGYLKELDRRVRWNAGPAVVEDWGSPHFDLIARRDGYWRAVPTLLEVARPPAPPP
ncbi:MAG TPA: formate dehydrogenase accessory protein FdhE [Calidithermus sp.]|nr:formate dehydrogenase accessory protein FdhE [Calidithermus sp.]